MRKKKIAFARSFIWKKAYPMNAAVSLLLTNAAYALGDLSCLIVLVVGAKVGRYAPQSNVRD